MTFGFGRSGALAVTAARPLVRSAPRAAMFFPLVVLVAVLPGLYALTSWDLTTPGSWWGMRGLAVLDGWWVDQVPAAAEIAPRLEARAFRTVAFQPPLYAWLEALGLALSGDRDPRATVLPSYVAGALGGRAGLPPRAALAGSGGGAVRGPLDRVQLRPAGPDAAGDADDPGAGRHAGRAALLRRLISGSAGEASVSSSTSRTRVWGGPITWTVLGGVALGLTLMAVGPFGLVSVPVVLLHQAYLCANAPRGAARGPARSGGGSGSPGATRRA